MDPSGAEGRPTMQDLGNRGAPCTMGRMRRLPFGLVGLASAACLVAAQLFACGSFSDDPGSAPDGGGSPDALRDASASDGRPLRFCEATGDAGLCADFDDENEPVSFHFLAKKGDVTLDPSLFLSPPAAMNANGLVAFLVGQAALPALARRQRLAFDTYQGATNHDASTVPKNAIIARIEQPGSCLFDFQTFGDRARLNVNVTGTDGAPKYENDPLSAYAPAGRWAHIEIVLEQPTSSASVSVTVRVDKVIALAATPTICPALASTPLIALGFVVDEGSTAPFAQANYDNVLFDAK